MPAILTATDFTESDHSKIMTGSFMTVGRWSCVFPSSATPAVSESNSHNLNDSGAKPRITAQNTRPYEKDDPPMAYAYPPTRIP